MDGAFILLLFLRMKPIVNITADLLIQCLSGETVKILFFN